MKKIILSALFGMGIVFLTAAFHRVFADTLYTVQPGDSLSAIAQAKYGDMWKWTVIYDANKNIIANPNIIFAGQTIDIPDNTANYQPSVPTYHYVAPAVAQYPRGLNNYLDVINAAAAQYHVDPVLMEKIIACESGFNPNAHNPSGASGIAQFMPGTYYGSWNIYKNQYPLYSPIGQIYAMALKISEGGVNAWQCYHLIH